MMAPPNCPPREELTDYLAGNLPDLRHHAVTVHIDDCTDCQQRLEHLAQGTDSLQSDLRGPALSGCFEYEPECEQAVARLKDGGPQLDNEAPTLHYRRLTAGRLLPGRISDCEVLAEIARGGMGVVYKARQRALNRVVALKMILAGEYADGEERDRFQVEAEAVARLQHPNIVQIFECGLSDGKPYLALEYCEGGSLAARLDGTPLPPAEAARLVEQLARAIAAAHRAGIVHRDLKPANVLLANPSPPTPLPQGEWGVLSFPLSPWGRGVGGEGAIPKISDFGLAKKLDDPAGQTRTGSILGTPSYMAPEQALGDGKRVGPAADIYALGAILFELMTGRPPFKAASVLETLEQVRTQEPVPPRVLQPRLPRDLETICLKCLRKDPGQRYATAEGLADDLGAFLEGRPVQARPVGWLEKTVKYARRHPAVATAALTVVASLLAILGLMANHSVQLAHERDLAQDQEKAANRARADAEQSRDAEKEARRDAENRLVETLAALGRSAETAENLPEAALWFALGAQQAAGDPERAELLRRRCRADLAINPAPWRAVQQPGGPINLVRLHPAGRWLVAGAENRPWQLWDLAAEKSVTWPGPARTVTAAAWSPDGQLLATGTEGGQVHLWAVDPAGGLPAAWQASGRLPEQQPDSTLGWIRFLTFDPANRRLAVVAQQLRVWDLAAGRALTPDLAHDLPVIAVAFSPGGGRLATIDQKGDLRVFDLGGDGSPRLLFGPKPFHRQGLVSSSSWDMPPAFLDEDRVFTCNGWEVMLHDLASGKVLQRWPGTSQGITAFASPEGRSFIVRREVGGTELWRGLRKPPGAPLDKGGLTQRIPLSTPFQFALARFSPEGGCFLTTGPREFRLWDSTGAPLSSTFRGQDALVAEDCTPAARWFAVRTQANLIQLWRGRRGPPLLARLPVPEIVEGPEDPGVCFISSADRGRVLAVRPQDDRWQLLAHDTKTGQPVGSPFTVAGRPFGGAISPDYRTAHVITREENGGQLSAWDLASGRPVFQAQTLAAVPLDLQLSPDDRRVVLVTSARDLQVRDAATGAVVGRQRLSSVGDARNPPRRIRFSHDGQSFVTFGFHGGGAQQWAAADGAPLRTLARGRLVRDARFSANDRLLLTSAILPKGHEVSVWEVATGRPTADPLRLPDLAFQARFDPSGERVVLARGDKKVSIWDWRSSKQPTTNLVLPGEVSDAAWSPDGRWIATAVGGTVRLWDAHRGSPVTPEWRLLDPGRRPHYYANHLEFTPDGRRLLVLTRGRHISLLDLSSLCEPAAPELSADDLVLLAEINAGHRTLAGDSVEPLSSQQWLERWRRFRARHPDFHPLD